MGYKVNPLSMEALRELAVKRLGVSEARENRGLTAEQASALLEEVAISKVEVEIQNAYLQETCARLDEALNEATDLYNFAPVGCVSTDPAGRITRLNLTGAHLLGQERHRLIGCDFPGFFVPHQRARVRALMQQAAVSGEDQSRELLLDCGRSVATHVQLLLSPIAGGQGYQVVLNNISTHKSVEDDLRANEARWKFALDAAGDGVWDWDVRSDTVTYSPRLAQLYGCAAEQFGATLEAWRVRVHPDDWAGLLGAMQKCLLGLETRFCNAHRGRCKNGQWTWILCQGAVFARDESGQVTRMVGTHSDISQHKQLEEELQEMAGIQQALFESLPQYLAVLDANGCVLKTNAVWNAYGLAHGHAYHNGFAGSDYAELLDAVTGGEEHLRRAALAGIADVTSGKAPRFQLEYAFQAGAEQRRFVMQVMAVRSGRARVLVSHQDVSRFGLHAPAGAVDQAQGLLLEGLG